MSSIINHHRIIRLGKKEMKKRSIWEWAEYCKKKKYNLRTGRKHKPYVKCTEKFYNDTRNYYEYFGITPR